MKLTSSLVALLIWILRCVSAGLAWPPGASRNRTGREVTCREGLEYPHAGICCLNCPAGTYVKQSCSRASERGICETCDFGSYTEHVNGLHKCLPCTSCRSDQDLVGQCTSTQNTQCQCKKGLFCLPEQACEVCKTCSKCAEDEEVEKSCTASSNTVCRKKKGSARSFIAGPITAMVLSLMILLLMVILYWKAPTWSKRAVASCCPGGILMKKSSSDSMEMRQNGLNEALEDGVPLQPFIVQSPSQPVGAWTPVCVDLVEEEDRGLGDSLPTTTTSSQNSLCVCVQPSEPCPARYSPALSRPPPAPDNEKLRRLIPLNGDESLKKSFDLFEEIDVHYHNRFFRLLGLSDNAITNAESLTVAERVYQLLKVWMEKEGMKADFNTLIEALLRLNQRLSAENIIARAISNAYYTYEDE
ncbi:hematopoietic death receptor isoform X2 [Colossoma macropomum]|uniref:hematopoietic death receptor isoform X2 n=1 Tax=Colossoma macropomum TaxID=42526 RepID=UPI00186503A6|nr:hematopoietic death receptor isoform X2 [Colossoma macropomum]